MNLELLKQNILYLSGEKIDIESDDFKKDSNIDYLKIRKKVEPWLTALFQSEHLSLLVGTGLSIGLIGNTNLMSRMSFGNNFNNITKTADNEAQKLGRGNANFEDDLRVALKFLDVYQIMNKEKTNDLKEKINTQLQQFLKKILNNEKQFTELKSQDNKENDANKLSLSKLQILKNFLLSFGSRTATRERLNIFTTNYDRFIEYGLDEAGLHTIDRFIGKLQPVMRFHRIDLDYHYNPPGIRGEPRYVEGVVKLTKLHGSLDWKYYNDKIIKIPLPFGAAEDEFKKYHPDILNSVVIFPNSSKAYETSFFPYSELFRDFSSAVCRPNSVLVTYGYGFGDSHINRIILDMLTIPSTHLVIISYDKASGRINNFINQCNPAQLTLLIGSELGDLEKLVTYYLPKQAIDRISEREKKVLEKRSIPEQEQDNQKNSTSNEV
ncbi:MAG: SIR2 family protein [candidate division WOR-3 bacterium]